MKLLLVFSILAVAICANGATVKDALLTDKEMFLRIIECSQKALLNGIPEIGLPSHDPLHISSNFSTELSVLNYSIGIALENMIMEGIPWWNVTQMDEKTEDPDTPVFDYTIYWKMMSFEGDWKVSVTDGESAEPILEDHGAFGIELDHLTFAGLFNITKPAEGKEDGGFNDLTLHFHTEESVVHFDGLGLVSSVLKLLGGPALTDIVNLDLVASVAGPAIRDKLNKDWIHKPERVEALIAHCNDDALY